MYYDDDDDRSYQMNPYEVDEDEDLESESDYVIDDHETPEQYRIRGNLRDWVIQGHVNSFIAQQIILLIKAYCLPEIHKMMESNKCTLEIDHIVLSNHLSEIASWLDSEPRPVLDAMELAAYQYMQSMHDDYLTTHRYKHIYVSVKNYYPNVSDKLKPGTVNFVRIRGLVTQLSQTSSYLVGVKNECTKCYSDLGFFPKNSDKVGPCHTCKSEGPFDIEPDQDIYLSYECLALQNLDVLDAPVYTNVILLNDMIGFAQPGEEIEVTGIFMNQYNLPIVNDCSNVIEANHITKKHAEFSAYQFPRYEKSEIMKLSLDPRIDERIIKSIAPSLPGHLFIKTTLALAMFGGQEKIEVKNYEDGYKEVIRVRGDIDLLLLCDPDTPISQFLEYVKDCVPKAVKVSGTGLATTVHQNTVQKEWTFKGGPLVLAHEGICIIDNFHQLNDQDRVTIQEAMKRQIIDTSKFGLVNPLQAACSIIAAANPSGGRYDSSKTFLENVNMEDTIVSEFDVLCVVKDVEDKITKNFDARVVKFDDEAGSDFEEETAMDLGEPEIIPQHMLKRYITYARSLQLSHIHPLKAYMEREGEVPAPERHLRSMLRLAEARARIFLRTEVNREDLKMAFRVMSVSLIATKKLEQQEAIDKTLSGIEVS